MQNHEFTDDVAITFALTKNVAIKKFKKLYSYVDSAYVWKIRFWECVKRVAILTDY